MSILIQEYYHEIEQLIQYGGSRQETSIRRAFEKLLNEYPKKRNLLLVAELDYQAKLGTTVYPDGTLKDAMRLDWGYREIKDEFDSLMPVCSKEVKVGKGNTEAIFELFSSGVKSQRDEWAYDFSKEALTQKIRFLTDVYQKTIQSKDNPEKFLIKWDRELEKYLSRSIKKKFEAKQIVKSIYRPYVAQWFYFDKHFNGMTYQWFSIYQNENTDKSICISGIGSSKDFQTLATKHIGGLDFLEKTQCLPLYR